MESPIEIDKEWPPPTSSTSSLNDIDPFADWPPRPSGTSTGSGASSNWTNTPNIMNLQNKGDISWAFNNQSSYDPLKPTQGTSAVNSGSLNSGPNPQNSIGVLKQNQNTSTLGSYNNTKSTDPRIHIWFQQE
ncbi:hypothetical protein OIU84_017436 [Salix udensis]|uniref:Uncharacterized protein n=1 Tax=Salix udensis TaxID=889485 RepID=A0AAD6L1V3_9ROSI|nr:hypothetical protein OIU84_017436 [Salix udensis]